ncbi:MAG: right-handed parallel beta-helix repeat-containing protein [Parachlamydiales bacterium]|nr:right-handed parallel beta-helix repeat-containing protein [Parachlamydiales bacterium]
MLLAEEEVAKGDKAPIISNQTVCIPEYSICNKGPRLYRVYADYIFGRGVGFNEGYSTLGFFMTPAFKGDWLPFLDIRGHLFNDGKWAANGGAGVRYFIEPLQIFFGMNGFYDYRRYQKTNFNQAGFGIEFLGNRFAFRSNGYMTFGRDEKIIGYSFNKFEGNNAFYYQNAYLSMWGVDAELEARLYSYKEAELELAAGPYYYKTNSTFDKDTVGGRIRATLQYRNMLYATGTTTFDHIFDWRWQGEVGINLPFGPKLKKKNSSEKTYCSICSNDAALLRRASAPVQRQEILVISKQKRSILATNPGTGMPLIFWHVNNLGLTSGSGTFESPFSTLAAGQTASNPGDSIIVHYGNGSSLGYNAGITLKPNQHLLGTAAAFLINTQNGNIIVPALTPGFYPSIINLGANIVTLSDGNEVGGLMLTGGANGIFGSNLAVAPYIHDNRIFNTGVAAAPQEGGIRLTWTSATTVAGTLQISNNLLTLATGAVAAQNNGIFIDFTAAAGANQLDVFIQNNQIISNNVSGIQFDKTGASTLLLTGNIDNNNITGNTNNGIHFNHSVAGATSMTLNMAITNNNISGNATAAGNAGILSASAVAAVSFSQGTLKIKNNYIANNANFAIDIQLTGTNMLGAIANGNSLINNGSGARFITNTATTLLDLELRNNTAVSAGYVLTRTAGIFQVHLSDNTGPLTETGTITVLP